MGRNTFGGKKAKKMKNSGPVKRDIVYPENSEYYAVIDKFNSHSNINLYYFDSDDSGEKMVFARGVIRGKQLKRIKKGSSGDILIVCKRDFESKKTVPTVDIIHKYPECDKSVILKLLPKPLKTYIDKLAEQSHVIKEIDVEEVEEIEFNDDDLFMSKSNNNFLNNTISTNYMRDLDISESEEEIEYY
jgi:hypothetical protein